jgi:hypothetical protein
MSDAISKAIEALESALDYIDESPCDSDITAYQIVAYDRFLKSNAVAALAELKALQSGERVGYIVRIDGDYKFYESYEDAQDDRASEEYWHKYLDHAEPEPVYTTPQPAVPEVRVLSRDEARLALWKAIQEVVAGNPTDDKLILENLYRSGVWLCLLSAGKGGEV